MGAFTAKVGGFELGFEELCMGVWRAEEALSIYTMAVEFSRIRVCIIL
jgi:hypothetical protein